MSTEARKEKTKRRPGKPSTRDRNHHWIGSYKLEGQAFDDYMKVENALMMDKGAQNVTIRSVIFYALKVAAKSVGEKQQEEAETVEIPW